MIYFKNTFRILCTVILLTSCNTDNSTEIEELKSEIQVLKSRVNSLEINYTLATSKNGSTSRNTQKKSKKKSPNLTSSIIQSQNQNTDTKGSESDAPSLSAESATPSQPIKPINNNPTNSLYKKPTTYQSGYSNQCHGITKKGYRCSRTVRSGSYCWQHGG